MSSFQTSPFLEFDSCHGSNEIYPFKFDEKRLRFVVFLEDLSLSFYRISWSIRPSARKQHKNVAQMFRLTFHYCSQDEGTAFGCNSLAGFSLRLASGKWQQ